MLIHHACLFYQKNIISQPISMKNLAEIIFDSSYLILIISMGVAMIIKSRNRKLILLFGIMALVLGIGDSFHFDS